MYVHTYTYTHIYTHTVVSVHEEFVKKPIKHKNAEIELPQEVVKDGVQGLKIVSFLFKNMSGLLLVSVNNTDIIRLVSALN